MFYTLQFTASLVRIYYFYFWYPDRHLRIIVSSSSESFYHSCFCYILKLTSKLLPNSCMFFKPQVLKSFFLAIEVVGFINQQYIMKELLDCFNLRIHWRLLTILKTSNKDIWGNVFWYVKVCVFWKCIQYTIHWDKTNVKKIPFQQNKQYKNTFFFFCKLPLITVLLLIWDSYMSWSTRFVSLKLCVGFSIFDSVSFSLKFIFLFKKMHGLFDFKTT